MHHVINIKIIRVKIYFSQMLLSMPSAKEKYNKQIGEEILELLSKPTAKERSLAEKFKSQGGAQVMEFCPYGTRVECDRVAQGGEDSRSPRKRDRQAVLKKVEKNAASATSTSARCSKLHFKKIIQFHTDETLVFLLLQK